MKDRIAGMIVYAVVRLVSFLPLPVSQAIGRGIGWLSYVFNTRGARVTATNLELCMPGLDADARAELARASLVQTGMMAMETPATWLGGRQRIARWINRIENERLLTEPIERGTGVVVLLPHIGNWEIMNLVLAEVVGSMTALYALPRKEWLRPLMSEVRNRYGNEMVPTTRSGLATLLRRLEEGRVVVILPDQVPASGKFAPFFGHMALTDTLLTRLCARTGAKVAACVVERLPKSNGFNVTFTEPHPDIYADDPDKALTGMNKSIEACVEKVPAQYQWEYKRFKERPSGELRLYNYKGRSTHH